MFWKLFQFCHDSHQSSWLSLAEALPPGIWWHGLPSLKLASGSARWIDAGKLCAIISAVSFALAILDTRIVFMLHGPNLSSKPFSIFASLWPVNSACFRPSGVKILFSSSYACLIYKEAGLFFNNSRINYWSINYNRKEGEIERKQRIRKIIYLVLFIVLTMTNQYNVLCNSMFPNASFHLQIFLRIASAFHLTPIPIFIP